jgi:hypothetical protein
MIQAGATIVDPNTASPCDFSTRDYRGTESSFGKAVETW